MAESLNYQQIPTRLIAHESAVKNLSSVFVANVVLFMEL